MAESIADRLAAVDGAKARADASTASFAALMGQVEAARLAMEADGSALEDARRAVVNGLLSVGGAAYLTGPDGARSLVEVFRGTYRVGPLGDGTVPIPIG